MTSPDQFHQIIGFFVATANAHHAATGGVNPSWAAWYAKHLLDDLNGVVHTEMDVDELESWLEDADHRYRNEQQTVSWPKAYATWLMADRQ